MITETEFNIEEFKKRIKIHGETGSSAQWDMGRANPKLGSGEPSLDCSKAPIDLVIMRWYPCLKPGVYRMDGSAPSADETARWSQRLSQP
jgi:hypothetical protein